jgi:pimeloyl-ACP methyl ester carboxylesterase
VVVADVWKLLPIHREVPNFAAPKEKTMRRFIKLVAVSMTMLVMILIVFLGSAQAQMGVVAFNGTLADGATYLIEVPPGWNGTLVLYSHGYVVPGSPNPAADVGDPVTRGFLLANGYALAGSSYATTGWALQQALPDQIAVLDQFRMLVGKAKRTIAWGHSLGGMITAGLIQKYPHRFDAALPMCGVLSGGVATWNTALDAEFAFQTLLASGSGLQLVNITDPATNLGIAEAVLAGAQATPQGQARLALVAALGNIPGWFTPTSPQPSPTDYASQEANQFLWAQQVTFPFVFAFRAELEARAGGNVSWNEGVDYKRQLAISSDRAEVKALYEAAGLNLDDDLNTLNQAPRIQAKVSAVDYLERFIIYDGQIHIPVFTLHTSGDGLVVAQNERAYLTSVTEAGNDGFLEQAFVHRAGHCAFTPAETVVAFQTLINRLDTGTWQGVHPGVWNREASALGPQFNIFLVGGNVVPQAPAFFGFEPSQYLRPFDGLTF